MTSHEVVQLLKKSQELMGDKANLLALLHLCTNFVLHLEDDVAALFSNLDKRVGSNHLAEVKSSLQNFVKNVKEIGSRKVYGDTERLIEGLHDLMKLSSSLKMPVNPFFRLVRSLEIFIDRYEKFIQNSEAYETWWLVNQADDLETALSDVNQFAFWFIEQLEPEVPTKSGCEGLSILMPYTTDYDEVVSKLSALGEIHTELCNLLGVSSTEYKLEIRKIESGSLWISVISNALIIGFIISLIKSAISFIHRNYTAEGKIAFIPRELEAADNILEFTKKAQDAGIDVTASRENVQKALFNISSKLNDLVADQPSIEVNGEVHSVAQAQDERFLRESKRFLLEDGTQDEQDEQDD